MKDESACKIGAIRGEPKGLASTLAKARNERPSTRSGKLERIVGNGIQIPRNLIRIEMTHCLDRFVWRKLGRPPFCPRPESKSGATAMYPASAS